MPAADPVIVSVTTSMAKSWVTDNEGKSRRRPAIVRRLRLYGRSRTSPGSRALPICAGIMLVIGCHL